ncbi:MULTISPECIES: DedA family protein [Bacillaceae]|uniref:DedA family protein n=1 Tax=Bacillaceae TaxID=186817 RepID=UPI000BEE7928|nr:MULTISPECIES: DedA family protein [unclassified Bacillus (in: firmicutes)]PEC51517.1 alkaline phosphatase [Bacillus sp. AFS096315]PFM78687.1 alkaline phosphatase [Bacillus sp. AFS077874]
MQNWIIETMDTFGYLGIFLLIALENIFPPIPSEVILTFGGFMTTESSLSKIGVIFFSTLGSVIGAIILFWIGTLLDIKTLEKIVERWGHFLRLTKKDVHKADEWFSKYGVWTVFFCRLIPLIRSLISIPAGMARMNFWIFLLFTTLGSLIWNTILVLVGASVGASWEKIVEYMDVYSSIIYVILAIGLVVFTFLFIKKRKHSA